MLSTQEWNIFGETIMNTKLYYTMTFNGWKKGAAVFTVHANTGCEAGQETKVVLSPTELEKRHNDTEKLLSDHYIWAGRAKRPVNSRYVEQLGHYRNAYSSAITAMPR